MVNKLQSHDFMKEEGGSAGTFFSSMLETDRVVGSTTLPSSGLAPQRYCDNIFLFLFFSFIFISWRLITSQHCSGFCHTLT